jgi:hypothetical protein
LPYREKTAWLMLIAIAVTFGPYFTIAAKGQAAGPGPHLHQLVLFGVTVVAEALILIVGNALLAAMAPQDARTPPDERDRAIASRSITWAYYVLISGMILVGCVMPFSSNGWEIINAALAMIVAAELVHYGVIAVSYRRQA